MLYKGFLVSICFWVCWWHAHCLLVDEITVKTMKTNPFNICPTCVYNETCVLTTEKSQVWSCSEYDEETTQSHNFQEPVSIKSESQQEMVMT